MQVKSWLKNAGVVGLTAALLAGCSSGGGESTTNTESGTIKVLYYDEGAFQRDYGMLFGVLYENIDFEVITTNSIYRNNNDDPEFDYEKAYAEFIDKEKPDLIMIDTSQVEKLAQEGKLHDLKAYMTKDNFDTEGFIPGMMEYMEEIGEGQIYGFPTTFSSQVLYYNKDLFDKYSIEYPTDKMSYSEVMQLANRFPADGSPEDRVYGMKLGYGGGDLSQMVMILAESEGLNYVNAAEKQMTINSDAWKNVVETALTAMKSDAFYKGDDNGFSGRHEDYLLSNPFISNRLAMTVEHSYIMNEIKQAQEFFKEEPEKVISNWDVVTAPVNVQNPDQSSSMYYGNIFAIHAESVNKELAWKFISYIASDKYARVKSKTLTYDGFPVRTKYIKDDGGRNFEAFYKLKPAKNRMYEGMDKLNPQFGMLFYQKMSDGFNAIAKDEKTIDEVLETLQNEGNELLMQEALTDEEMQKMMEEMYGEQMNRMREAAGESVSVELAE